MLAPTPILDWGLEESLLGILAPLGTLEIGDKGWSGGSCWDHILIPWPPPDGQLRPRRLSAGRRAVSVHEDQLQAPVGEGTLPWVLGCREGWLWVSLHGSGKGATGGVRGEKPGSKGLTAPPKEQPLLGQEDTGVGEALKQ